MPVLAVSSMLGIPPDDVRSFGDWSARLGAVFSIVMPPEVRSDLEAALAEFTPYVRALIADRRRKGLDLHDEVWEGVYYVMPNPNVEHQDLIFGVGIPLRRLIEVLDDELASADDRFAAMGTNDVVVKRLTTLPSIGPITATAFVAHSMTSAASLELAK